MEARRDMIPAGEPKRCHDDPQRPSSTSHENSIAPSPKEEPLHSRTFAPHSPSPSAVSPSEPSPATSSEPSPSDPTGSRSSASAEESPRPRSQSVGADARGDSAYEQGRRARAAGRGLIANPYRYPSIPGTDQNIDPDGADGWCRGWWEKDSEIESAEEQGAASAAVDARRHELDLSIREILERSERIVGCDLVERLEKLEAKMREEDAVVPVIVEQLRRIRDAAENIGKRLDGHDARLDRIDLATGVGADVGRNSIARHREIIDGWGSILARVSDLERRERGQTIRMSAAEEQSKAAIARLDDLEAFRGSILDQREPVSVWGRDVNERLRLVEETAVNASRKASALEDAFLERSENDPIDEPEHERTVRHKTRGEVIDAVRATLTLRPERTYRDPVCWLAALRGHVDVVDELISERRDPAEVAHKLIHLSATAIQIAAEGRLSR